MSALPQAAMPSPTNRWFEATAPLEFASLLPAAPWLLNAPRGDGRPVMLVPGFFASGRSMTPLAAFLRYLGYDVIDWGLGTNQGDVEADIERLGERVQQRFDEGGQQALTMLGWSLGGVLAREVARLFEPAVREVITMGTPIIGGPKYTAVGELYARSRGLDLDEFEHEVHARNSIGLKQPVTAIYSKRDGVVGWQAAVDIYNPQANNIEVNGSHIGLGVNPNVWLIISRTLAKGRAN